MLLEVFVVWLCWMFLEGRNGRLGSHWPCLASHLELPQVMSEMQPQRKAGIVGSVSEKGYRVSIDSSS